jgi:TonB family protein
MKLPARVGKYRIEKRLGQGGMGTVCLAYDEKINRLVALKFLRVDNDDMRHRFEKEAQAAGRLQHPNIVTLFDYAEEDGTPYLVLEYVEGRTLSDAMRSGFAATMVERIRMIRDVLNALHIAHRAGIIHRDIKPSNLMLTPSGVVKVLDFGIARNTDTKSTKSSRIVGTISYMAPEQIRTDPIDGRCDVFAVGAVLQEVLTGKLAFDGETDYLVMERILRGQPAPFEHPDPFLNALIRPVVAKALEKNRDDRFADASAFADTLDQVIARIEEAQLLGSTNPQSTLIAPAGFARHRATPLGEATTPAEFAFTPPNRTPFAIDPIVPAITPEPAPPALLPVPAPLPEEFTEPPSPKTLISAVAPGPLPTPFNAPEITPPPRGRLTATVHQDSRTLGIEAVAPPTDPTVADRPLRRAVRATPRPPRPIVVTSVAAGNDGLREFLAEPPVMVPSTLKQLLGASATLHGVAAVVLAVFVIANTSLPAAREITKIYFDAPLPPPPPPPPPPETPNKPTPQPPAKQTDVVISTPEPVQTPVDTAAPIEAPDKLPEPELPKPVPQQPLESTPVKEVIAAPAGEVFGSEPVDRFDIRARVLEEPVPEWPADALRQKIQFAQVTVEVVVTRDGEVIRPRIVKGVDLFNEAALATAVKYKFRPARLRGQAVATRVELVIRFDVR